MTAPSAAHKLCDTSDMVIVHRMFRRECALLPQLVAAVAAGDVARARTVAGHAREVLDMLHHHHLGEDELLWPRLSARTRFHADLLARMDSQHQGLAVLLERAATALPAWQDAPTARTSTPLTAVLEQISTGLNEHFDEEEAEDPADRRTRDHRRRIPGGGPTGTGVDTPDTPTDRAGLPPRRGHPAGTNRLPRRHTRTRPTRLPTHRSTPTPPRNHPTPRSATTLNSARSRDQRLARIRPVLDRLCRTLDLYKPIFEGETFMSFDTSARHPRRPPARREADGLD